MLTVVGTEVVGRGLRVEGRGWKVFQTNGQGLVCIDASWSVVVLAAARVSLAASKSPGASNARPSLHHFYISLSTFQGCTSGGTSITPRPLQLVRLLFALPFSLLHQAFLPFSSSLRAYLASR
jgi:hypothetical protein